MTITFTNTVGTGWNSVNSGTGTVGSKAITTPTDAGSGDLLLCFTASGGGSYSAYTPTLDSVTGESDITSIHQAISSYVLELHCLQAALSGAPTNCDVTMADEVSMRRAALAMVVTGHDTGSPIRAYATGYGTGTTITFPDTSSVNDGDMVLRWCIVGKEDVSQTFTGFGGTTIWSDPQSGNYANGVFLGYSTKSGAGAPGTATLTSNASREWAAMTVVVSLAGGDVSISLPSTGGATTSTGERGTEVPNLSVSL